MKAVASEYISCGKFSFVERLIDIRVLKHLEALFSFDKKNILKHASLCSNSLNFDELDVSWIIQ